MEILKIPTKNDAALNLVHQEYGLKGFAIAIMIMQEIVWNDGMYEWNDSTIKAMSQDCGASINLIKEVTHSCVRTGLFSLSKNVLMFGKESGKIGRLNRNIIERK